MLLFSWNRSVLVLTGRRRAAGPARAVRSPDGKIAVTIHTDAPLGYSITVDGKPLLLRSRLGLELAGDVKLGEKPVVQGEKRNSADNHWFLFGAFLSLLLVITTLDLEKYVNKYFTKIKKIETA